jgi:FixJ family two-component response regulator
MSAQRWVAVIDDDPSVRTAIGRLLRLSGIHAVTYASAEDYLKRAESDEPHCMLLDVHLGSGLDGFQLQERLTSVGAGAGVIFMTGHAEVRFPSHDRRGEPVEHLRKPIDIEMLLTLVRRQLERSVGSLTP